MTKHIPLAIMVLTPVLTLFMRADCVLCEMVEHGRGPVPLSRVASIFLKFSLVPYKGKKDIPLSAPFTGRPAKAHRLHPRVLGWPRP